MAKINIEICIISARGLCRKTSLLKPHWFAVGWIDPNNKYCTKIDASGSPNPSWKTKFSILLDETNSKLQDMSLTVEVYRREPIFLREHLHGVATVQLKEFIVKYLQDSERLRTGFEETASFQLWKGSSGKAKGFVDISIHLSKDGQSLASHSGPQEGITYTDHSGITLAIEDGPVYTYPAQPLPSPQQFGPIRAQNPAHYPYTNPTPSPLNIGPHRPPPPPPPSNAGFVPPLPPQPARMPNNYINVAPSQPIGRSSGPGFGLGLGAGALAAGAMIFGDDFFSGSSLPSGFDGGDVIVSTDPPF